jgi:high-affinity nickel-transport protein
MSPVLLLGFALGLRHGTDPDHLAAIDGLTRLRPRPTNGLFFAMGHGFVVVLLAVGVGQLLAKRLSFLGPWTLIIIGAINLWRLLSNSKTSVARRPVVGQPLLLGMLLAAGFETSSQLSALILAGEGNPWLLGAVFSLGMVVVDGMDGALAAATQRQAALGASRAITCSRVLGVIVVIFSFGLGFSELAGFELDRVALPMGIGMFVAVVGIRIWARMPSVPVKEKIGVPQNATISPER